MPEKLIDLWGSENFLAKDLVTSKFYAFYFSFSLFFDLVCNRWYLE